MKESMKERSRPSASGAAVAAITPTAIAAISPASVAMIIVVMPEEGGKQLPLLDLHESFV
jgi:hypothetical protein